MLSVTRLLVSILARLWSSIERVVLGDMGERIMTEPTTLPKGFEDLEKFVPFWAGKTNDIRCDQRSRASMEEISEFYDAMLGRAEDALSWLEDYGLDAMPEEEGRLFCLLLSLVHASMSVELHKQPRARLSPFPHNIHIEKGPSPFGG